MNKTLALVLGLVVALGVVGGLLLPTATDVSKVQGPKGEQGLVGPKGPVGLQGLRGER